MLIHLSYDGVTLRCGSRRLDCYFFIRKQDGVVYKIPGGCDKVYIGKTGRWMYEGIKEHDSAKRLARTQASAVSEKAIVSLLTVTHTSAPKRLKRSST